MFKKPRDVAGGKENKLSGKDVKKLITSLIQCFPDVSEDELKESLGLFPKAPIYLSKLPNKVTVYSVGKSGDADCVVLFFDANGRGNFYPTLEALWKLPSLLPPLVVHAPVSQFVLNGSDVMLPGVVCKRNDANNNFGLGPLFVGQKRALYANGNPFAFAIGEMAIEKHNLMYGGFKGKGFEVRHYYRDVFWEFCGKKIPNEQFLTNCVEPLPNTVLDDDDEYEDDDETEAGTGSGQQQEGGATEKSVVVGEGGVEVDVENIDDNDDETDNDQRKEKPYMKWNPTKLLFFTFLYALKRKLKDEQLPILVSTFYSSMLIPSRPRGTNISIKDTEYKKVGKFLQAMQDKGLITLEGENGVDSICKVNRDAEEYALFRPWPVREEQETEDNEVAEQEQEGDQPQFASAGGSSNGKIQVFEYVRAVKGDGRSIVEAGNTENAEGVGPKQQYFTGSEIKRFLMKYIDKENLVDPGNKRMIVLNEPLKKTLKVTVDKMERGEVVTKFMGTLQHGYQVLKADGELTKFSAGKAPQVEIRVEKRQQRKHVTYASNFEVFGLDPSAIAKTARLKFSCACTATQSKRNPNNMELEIQGNVANALETLLHEEYGLSKNKYIHLK